MSKDPRASMNNADQNSADVASPRRKSLIDKAKVAVPIPPVQPVFVDTRYFNHPVSATVYPVKPTGYNPCLCCEACWCKGHSLINGSIAVGALELFVALLGITVAILRFFLVSGTTPEGEVEFDAYETRSLYGQKMLVFGVVPHSNKRSRQNRIFKGSKVEHFGLSDSERQRAEDIMIWFLGTLSFTLLIACIVLLIASFTKNRGLANTSLLLHLLVSCASWVYAILIIAYAIVIDERSGPQNGKFDQAGPFLLDSIIMALASVLFICGTICSNALYQAFRFDELLSPPPPPSRPSLPANNNPAAVVPMKNPPPPDNAV